MAEGQPTPLQKNRRDAVLRATLDVLREHGYDKARIQEVASRSGVALGTIYSYFGSRENLIFEATLAWITAATTLPRSRTVTSTIDEYMIRFMRDWADTLIAEPELLRAWARSHMSTDPRIVKHVREETMATSLSMYPGFLLSSTELATDIGIVLEHVWFTGIVRWSLGQKDFDRVHADAERAMLLVLSAHAK
jgi:AcrR family transcriptional regulator